MAWIPSDAPPFNPARGTPTETVVRGIAERLEIVERRLLIIDPPANTLAKYPALAEAYREYKLIERLTIGNDQT